MTARVQQAISYLKEGDTADKKTAGKKIELMELESKEDLFVIHQICLRLAEEEVKSRPDLRLSIKAKKSDLSHRNLLLLEFARTRHGDKLGDAYSTACTAIQQQKEQSIAQPDPIPSSSSSSSTTTTSCSRKRSLEDSSDMSMVALTKLVQFGRVQTEIAMRNEKRIRNIEKDVAAVLHDLYVIKARQQQETVEKAQESFQSKELSTCLDLGDLSEFDTWSSDAALPEPTVSE